VSVSVSGRIAVRKSSRRKLYTEPWKRATYAPDTAFQIARNVSCGRLKK
jgi:hypothetical protein